MTLRNVVASCLLAQAWSVAAQTQVQFNQVINLNGDMTLNSLQFPDGSKIETYSQTQRQLLVNQNTAPLSGNQVTGGTGNPFTQLSQNSLVVQTNGATDLVGAQIELKMNTQIMQQLNISSPDNVFVAKLAQDRQSWTIMDTIKTVNITDSTTRIVKMTNIDGEYIALARQTIVTGVALTQFGNIPQNQFNVSGSGITENEFADGFRMSVRATQPTIITMDVKNGISTTMLAAQPGVVSVNNFRYLVTTNLGGVLTNINRMAAVMQIPINPQRLQIVAQAMGASAASQVRLQVSQRGVLSNPGGAQNTGTQILQPQKRQQSGTPQSNGQTNQSQGTNTQTGTGTTNNNPVATQLLLSPTFTPIRGNAVLDTMNARLAVPVTQIDGEYIITVAMVNGGTTGSTPQLPNTATPSQGTQGVAGQASAALPAAEPSASQIRSAAPAAEPLPASSAPAAAAPAAPAAGPASAGGFTYKAKRQATVPSLPQSQSDGSVIVGMDWINYMAQVQKQGGAVDVSALMASVGAPAAAATSAPASVGSLIGSLKAREFRA